MSRAADLLKTKEQRLANSLNSCLRKSAFENRFSLHPRRLAVLGAEQARAFLDSLDAPDRAEAFAYGQKLAREGIGEKTILLVASDIQRFCRTELGSDIALLNPALDAADAFSSKLLDGFMKAREAQILMDQEQLRRALSTALQSQGEELLIKNHAINTSINGIMLADLNGKVTWVNASFLQMWGMGSAEEVIGAAIGDFWVGEDARDIVRVLPRTGGWHGELSARRKDGTVFSVELSASLIRNEEGGAIGLMTSIVDITESKRLQAQILQAQKMDAMGQLAGGIAHDFNNLLTAISGYLQLLLLNAPPGTQIHNDLLQIKAAVDRGTGLTKQLRLFTRQATGMSRIVLLNEIAQETYEIFHRTFPPEILIELSLTPSAWTIEADPNQMSQVLVNLCVNARDAMMGVVGRSPGGTLTIATTAVELTDEQAARYVNARPGQYVVMRVSDTGAGMPPELLERMFIPFVTTKGEQSGTGLGLAVVYGIVASHHGFIDVKSVVNEGTTFEIFLPRTERRDAEKPGKAVPLKLPQGRGKILVVDDEPQVREVISRILTAYGYEVILAENGREALTRFAESPGIDLVLLDMIMPDMGGRECLARLRTADPNARVLIATGYTSDGSAQELLREGALAIVEKPFDLTAITEKISGILGSTRG